MKHECLSRLTQCGIALDDATALRRISMTLHRWHELECGEGNDYASWSIERGKRTPNGFIYDENGAPYMITHWRDGITNNCRLADRERGAQKRLAKIMARYPGFTAYVQGDPRGAALYILPPGTVQDGETIDSIYSRGVAVYK